MGVEVFMQRLRVAVVAGEGVHSVESAGDGRVPAGAEVILGCCDIVHIAGKEQ